MFRDLIIMSCLVMLAACSGTPPKLNSVDKNAKTHPINTQQWIDFAKAKEIK